MVFEAGGAALECYSAYVSGGSDTVPAAMLFIVFIVSGILIKDCFNHRLIRDAEPLRFFLEELDAAFTQKNGDPRGFLFLYQVFGWREEIGDDQFSILIRTVSFPAFLLSRIRPAG